MQVFQCLIFSFWVRLTGDGIILYLFYSGKNYELHLNYTHIPISHQIANKIPDHQISTISNVVLTFVKHQVVPNAIVSIHNNKSEFYRFTILISTFESIFEKHVLLLQPIRQNTIKKTHLLTVPSSKWNTNCQEKFPYIYVRTVSQFVICFFPNSDGRFSRRNCRLPDQRFVPRNGKYPRFVT